MDLDLSILWFAVLYIVLDVFTSGMSGVIRASLTDHSSGAIVALALEHTLGAILGFVLGVALLKLKLVDCENWDLFAVLEGRAGLSKKQASKLKRPSRPVSVEFASAMPRPSRSRNGVNKAARRSARSRTRPPPRCGRCASILSSARWRWRCLPIGS